MRSLFLFGLIMLVTFCHSALAREWVDRTGKHKMVAAFVKFEDGNVVLKTGDGKTVRIPLNRLRKKDQEYVQQLLEKGSTAKSDKSSDDASSDRAKLPGGTLFGEEFQTVLVKMLGGQITFASDEERLPARSIQLHLFLGDKQLAGQKFNISPNYSGLSPSISLNTKKPYKTKFVNDYTMKLTFVRQQGKMIRGQIDLKIPEHKTTLSGTFVVEEPKNYKLPPTQDDAPFIVAEFKWPPSASGKDFVSAGYVGVTVDGNRISNGAGTSWSDNGSVSSLTFKPRVTSVITNRRGATAQHVSLEPGRYFHYVVWNHSYLIGEWVDVKASSQIKGSLKIDPADAGSLEVETSGDKDVRLVPFELSEKTKELNSYLRSLAFQLGLKATPENGKAKFDLVRAGKYVVVVDEIEQTVEIRPGKAEKVKIDSDNGQLISPDSRVSERKKKDRIRTLSSLEQKAIEEAERTFRPLTNGDFRKGLEGWNVEGGAAAFKTFPHGDARFLTTWGDQKDGNTGRLFQCFKVPKDAARLTFKLHGGANREKTYVALWHKNSRHGQIAAKNDSTPFQAHFQLTAVRDEVVTLEIVDNSTDGWGFIGVENFRIVKKKN